MFDALLLDDVFGSDASDALLLDGILGSDASDVLLLDGIDQTPPAPVPTIGHPYAIHRPHLLRVQSSHLATYAESVKLHGVRVVVENW